MSDFISKHSGQTIDDGIDRALISSIAYKGFYDAAADKFYTDNTKTTELPADEKAIYIDTTTSLSYQWNGTNYVQFGGGNGSVEDVKVDGTSVVDSDNVANIDLTGLQPKEEGKGLSTNDYTNDEKTKLAGLENYDDSEVRGLINNKSKVQDNHLTVNGTLLNNGSQMVVYDDTTIKQQLAGFNRNYVIDSEDDITGTQDPTSKKWTNVSAIGDLDMNSLKVGDNIYIKDDTVPDYWIVSAVSGIVGLDPLDTKTDLANYYNKTETDNLLAQKLNNIVEITLSGSSGTLTSEQLSQIQTEPYTTVIIISNYKYRCIYMSSSNIYFQRSITSSNSYISITVSTGAWSLTTTSLQTTANLEASTIGTSTSKYPSSYAVSTALGNKQDKLVSETNIKSLNGESILGSGGTDIPIGYYTCDTAAATVAKVGTWVSGAKYTTSYLPVGAIAVVKFTNNNTASSPTLNLNSSGAKALMRYGTTAISTTNETTGWYAGSVNIFTYDGTNWVRNQGHNTNSTYTIYYTTAYCSTGASTAAKVASCSGYVATANTFTVITFTTANTAASALTLNINSQGAKTIYINGSISSSSNYTIPAGTYIVYYTGTYYYLRTDGRLPYLNNMTNTTYGISIDSSQRFYIVQATSSEIQSKSGSYKPITPSTLQYVQQYIPMNLDVLTTAPTSANSYGLKAVYLTSEPSNKYAGYLYLIKE